MHMREFGRSLFPALVAAVAVAAMGVAARAQTPVPTAATAGEIVPPPGLQLVRRVQAGGEQVYACRAAANGAPTWTLVGPKAQLFNDDGSDFGTHAAGPRWTAADGSSIVADGGHPLARVERSGGVPALLLRVTTATGTGVLTNVKQISRTQTAGGLAPTGGCDNEHINATVGERYTAVYSFFQ